MRGRVCNFEQIFREGLSQDLKSHGEIWGKTFQTEGRASGRDLRHLRCGELPEQRGGQSGREQ